MCHEKENFIEWIFFSGFAIYFSYQMYLLNSFLAFNESQLYLLLICFDNVEVPCL